MTTLGWKVFTHDRRSPIQGGEPVWDGTYPFTLPTVQLDTSDEECAPGWNYCDDIGTVLRVAGLWPDGYPSLVVAVEPGSDALHRGNKWRASSLTLLREATSEEVYEGIRQLSTMFGIHAERMAEEQIKWRAALGRPVRDVVAVEHALRSALQTRGLVQWGLRQFDTAMAAWDGRYVWSDWDSSAAMTSMTAWAVMDVINARSMYWTGWNTRGSRGTWDPRDAWAGLTVTYAALKGWINHPPELLTTGLRDAYQSGLAVALPTGPQELGYVMAP